MVFRPSAPIALETLLSTVLGSCCPLVAAETTTAAKIATKAILRNIITSSFECYLVRQALPPADRAATVSLRPSSKYTGDGKRLKVTRTHPKYRSPPPPH